MKETHSPSFAISVHPGYVFVDALEVLNHFGDAAAGQPITWKFSTGNQSKTKTFENSGCCYLPIARSTILDISCEVGELFYANTTTYAIGPITGGRYVTDGPALVDLCRRPASRIMLAKDVQLFTPTVLGEGSVLDLCGRRLVWSGQHPAAIVMGRGSTIRNGEVVGLQSPSTFAKIGSAGLLNNLTAEGFDRFAEMKDGTAAIISSCHLKMNVLWAAKLSGRAFVLEKSKIESVGQPFDVRKLDMAAVSGNTFRDDIEPATGYGRAWINHNQGGIPLADAVPERDD